VRPSAAGALGISALAAVLLVAPGALGAAPGAATSAASAGSGHAASAASTPSPVANLTAALQRTVSLLALSGSGLLAVVWARVALSWFSNDVSKKVQAKDRARDALIGTVIFLAAVSGLLWGVAHWVVTGT
jgi:hypothetical protein